MSGFTASPIMQLFVAISMPNCCKYQYSFLYPISWSLLSKYITYVVSWLKVMKVAWAVSTSSSDAAIKPAMLVTSPCRKISTPSDKLIGIPEGIKPTLNWLQGQQTTQLMCSALMLQSNCVFTFADGSAVCTLLYKSAASRTYKQWWFWILPLLIELCKILRI